MGKDGPRLHDMGSWSCCPPGKSSFSAPPSSSPSRAGDPVTFLSQWLSSTCPGWSGPQVFACAGPTAPCALPLSALQCYGDCGSRNVSQSLEKQTRGRWRLPPILSDQTLGPTQDPEREGPRWASPGNTSGAVLATAHS
jgi:hypothetical protein